MSSWVVVECNETKGLESIYALAAIGPELKIIAVDVGNKWKDVGCFQLGKQ